MKTRLFQPSFAIIALLVVSGISTRSQTVVTFDDLHETGSGSYLQNGYQGLVWNNFLCNNAILFTNVLPHLFFGAPTNGLSGDYYGMVSSSNVAVVFSGSEIDSTSADFNFLSAYLTGFWVSNLNIEVQGYRDTNLIYDETMVASATNSTLFTFNYMDINRLYFNSFGGQDAGFGNGGGNQFVMDNFTFEFIPEPSSLLLTCLGVVMLWTIGRRRRA